MSNHDRYTENIRQYFSSQKVLGNSHTVLSISYLGGGNHFNYKVETGHGVYVARVSKPENIQRQNKHTVSDEYLLLTLLEKEHIAPKALLLDTESFDTPFLIEEYIGGTRYSDLESFTTEQLEAVISALHKVSAITIDESQFPFKYRYTDYSVHREIWNERIAYLHRTYTHEKDIEYVINTFTEIAERAFEILNQNQPILSQTKPIFTRHDVHGGNLIWLPREKEAFLIDWQKVSIGDPTFMVAEFALLFSGVVDMSRKEFFDWVIKKYTEKIHVVHFDTLFKLRVLEREVSNMIWVPWERARTGEAFTHQDLSHYDRYVRVKKLLETYH